MALLELDQVRKSFIGATKVPNVALESMSLQVHEGEFLALLGASGCGKTTTLRSIAGLETPDSGSITIDGRVVFSAGRGRAVFVPPERRALGMVFQSYALWPHMTVSENIGFGLAKKGLSRAEILEKIERSLRAVQLWELRDRRISQLSGGQQQRVAVARAIAPEPRIILFDEPLSNIDARLREDLRHQVLSIQKRMNLTAIWVTHDQDEAMGLATRIVLMNKGVAEQVGTPQQVWDEPATAFAAGFIGSSSELKGIVSTSPHGDLEMGLGDGKVLSLPRTSSFPSGTSVRAFVRSDTVRVGDDLNDSENTWEAPLIMHTFHGDYTMVVVQLGDQKLKFRSSTRIKPETTSLRISLQPESLLIFTDGEREVLKIPEDVMSSS